MFRPTCATSPAWAEATAWTGRMMGNSGGGAWASGRGPLSWPAYLLGFTFKLTTVASICCKPVRTSINVGWELVLLQVRVAYMPIQLLERTPAQA